ncbi:hypothetical protein RhiirB3_478821 [Rhizophagus irregularis]|nr:hypothetical protein RhiirB3_478821 [Rhizophagus irregularis]
MSRYSIFFFFFSQLIITSPYTLVGRVGHTASYMDNKIYFLGGMIEKYSDDTNDFFYLDVSKPFNLDSTLPIFDLSNDARYIHPHSYGVSSICGPNKDMIFIMCRAFKDSFSYRFINSKEWVPGTGATDIQWLSAVCNENGSRIYIYGSGYDDNEYFMTILYTTSWISVFLDKNNNNIMNYLSLAILLPKGRIVYIGNRYIDNELVNIRNDLIYCMFIILTQFRNIHIYDTNDGTWINMGTNGTIPSPRNLHTAVLTQDGLIIIYGGIREMRPVPDQILVLDTKVNPFTWSIPNIDPAPSSAPTSGHTATLVGNYMIVAFGNYNHTPQNIVYSDQIHMIDLIIKEKEDAQLKLNKQFVYKKLVNTTKIRKNHGLNPKILLRQIIDKLKAQDGLRRFRISFILFGLIFTTEAFGIIANNCDQAVKVAAFVGIYISFGYLPLRKNESVITEQDRSTKYCGTK